MKVILTMIAIIMGQPAPMVAQSEVPSIEECFAQASAFVNDPDMNKAIAADGGGQLAAGCAVIIQPGA